jgi:hypothetical protein
LKRYRVLGFDFDSRATILNQEICENWEEKVKKQWLQNKKEICEGLLHQYGVLAGEQKIKNFLDLDAKPFSVLAFHNTFLTDCRDAFTFGAYYPALTGACALGERILNHLILLLRDDYKATPEYKYVYRKDSFDNWNLAIDILSAWNVLIPEVSDFYRELVTLRNRTIHFNPEIDTNDRALSLEAIHLLQRIIQTQFGSFGTQPWFIQTIPGEAYIKKDFEDIPFIKKVYLPNCNLVGPMHRLEFENHQWIVHDDYTYEDIEISDKQFSELRIKK